ncbi:MAG: short-chain dehydrogenase [Halobacteriovoraceae bacterium]|nr:short-chain dehydrogenase [Halobacteriovoraceae bacterium]|tara:strand:- start:3439 stop:4092 length:654 start_codon:yes stop_codon:yes gene_type:complete
MHVVIIGGNKGIGLALVKKFLSHGHRVSVTCRETSQELAATQAKIITDIDVTKEETTRTLSQKIGDIDMLIHCAGVLISDSLDKIDISNISKQFEVNALGPLKTFLSLRKNLKKGSKVGFLTSRMGSIEDNTSGGQYGYRTSKTALNAIAKSLAVDLKPSEIAVFLLHPGYVKTSMTNYNGLIETDESADGLYDIMMTKSLEDSGSFWHTNGEQLPW